MRHCGRTLALLALQGVAALACADRLILIPTGKKIGFDEVRAEVMFGGRPSYTKAWLGVGIGQQFDAELVYEHLSPSPQFLSFNFAYNYITPVTDLSPGVSIGVRDGLNRTLDGRAFYVASTLRVATDIDAPAEFTLGAGTQSLRGVFVGAMLPLSPTLRLLGEHDSRRWTAGVEWAPLRGGSIRVLFQQDRTLLSVGATVRF